MTTRAKKENTTVITVKFNQEKGGIELAIPDGRRLSTAERNELRELGFSWHRKNGYYYTRYSEEKMAEIKQSFLKDSKFPAATSEKKVAAAAQELEAKREAERAAKPKKETKKSAQAQRLDALEENMASISTMLAQLVGAMQTPPEADEA